MLLLWVDIAFIYPDVDFFINRLNGLSSSKCQQKNQARDAIIKENPVRSGFLQITLSPLKFSFEYPLFE